MKCRMQTTFLISIDMRNEVLGQHYAGSICLLDVDLSQLVLANEHSFCDGVDKWYVVNYFCSNVFMCIITCNLDQSRMTWGPIKDRYMCMICGAYGVPIQRSCAAASLCPLGPLGWHTLLIQWLVKDKMGKNSSFFCLDLLLIPIISGY